MNSISINPVKVAGDTRVFITVTSDNGNQIRSVKIKDNSESFDYELSAYPTYLSESEARDFLRMHLEDLLTAVLDEYYFVIVAPYMYNDVPVTQYIRFNEKDPSAFIVTDNIKVGTWWESYTDALAALKELPSYLQGCKIRKITIS